MSEEKQLTIEDFARVWIRVKNNEGEWIEVNCYVCSDFAFDSWARSKMHVEGTSIVWPIDERVRFCQMLWDAGILHMQRD